LGTKSGAILDAKPGSQESGHIFRCWVAMELMPCEMCTAKMSAKGELVEINSRFFFGERIHPV
jgi:hypothetical protein